MERRAGGRALFVGRGRMGAEDPIIGVLDRKGPFRLLETPKEVVRLCLLLRRCVFSCACFWVCTNLSLIACMCVYVRLFAC